MSKFKFPVPQLAEQIQADWAPQLCRHLGVESLAGLLAMDFPVEGLRLRLMDESELRFHCAFAIVDEERRAIAVFTEHCGYHVFPYWDAELYVGERLVYSQASGLGATPVNEASG